MSTNFPPLSEGLLYEAATRCARDLAACGAAAPMELLAGLGWAGLLLPEDQDGAGGTLADLAAIVEPLAAHAIDLPVAEACAVVPLLMAADPARGGPLLSALAGGEIRPLPLVDASRPLAAPSRDGLRASPAPGGLRLDGQVRGVATAPDASHWLVVAWQADGEPVLGLLPAAAITPAQGFRALDGGRCADFALDGVPLPQADILATGEAARQALARAELAAVLATCVDITCAGAALVEQTIEYLKNRRQFDTALSSFQVLRHRVVDMYVRCRSARGQLEQFLADPGADLAAAARKLRLMKLSMGETARLCAEAAIQCHGGMGISEEVLATRLAQRLVAADFRWGDRYACLQALQGGAPAAPAQPLPAFFQPAPQA